jgi:ribosomal-protein-alanine N-acetyltransferase
MVTIAASFGSIRTWALSDIDSLAKYANNRNVSINLRDGFPYPYTAEDARSFITFALAKNPTTFLAIATPQEAIGGIGISLNHDVHRLAAEMGYWLGEPFWGRGIMTEAVARFCEYAFAGFGLVRIYAEPYADNTGSCRVLENAGFPLEGRMRASVIKEGRIMDQLLYARIATLP